MQEGPETEADDIRKGYYAEAQTWADDRVDQLARSLRLTRVLAVSAGIVAVVEALVLIALLPLKTVVPYTILVDRNTGFAQALDERVMPNVKPESALTQSLLAQYVVARETFDINGLQNQYRKVALWSAEQAKHDYLASMPEGNPDSPLNRYPRSTIVETVVESVTPTSENAALVRFYTERHDRGGSTARRDYWVSLARFRFSGAPMALEDRLINPLGFQVMYYRRDQETPPPAPPATAMEPASGQPGGLLPPASVPTQAITAKPGQ